MERLLKNISKIYNIYFQFIGFTILMSIYILLVIELKQEATYYTNLRLSAVFILLLNVILISYNTFEIIKIISYKMMPVIINSTMIVFAICLIVTYSYLMLTLIIKILLPNNYYSDTNKLLFYLSGVIIISITPYIISFLIRLVMKIRIGIFKIYNNTNINKLYIDEILLGKIITYVIVILLYISLKLINFSPEIKQIYKKILHLYLTNGEVLYKLFKEQILEICVAFTMIDCLIVYIQELSNKNIKK